MKKLPARVIADYRTTIPVEFREMHDLEVGQRIWVWVAPIEEGTDKNPYSRADLVRDL